MAAIQHTKTKHLSGFARHVSTETQYESVKAKQPKAQACKSLSNPRNDTDMGIGNLDCAESRKITIAIPIDAIRIL